MERRRGRDRAELEAEQDGRTVWRIWLRPGGCYHVTTEPGSEALRVVTGARRQPAAAGVVARYDARFRGAIDAALSQ